MFNVQIIIIFKNFNPFIHSNRILCNIVMVSLILGAPMGLLCGQRPNYKK